MMDVIKKMEGLGRFERRDVIREALLNLGIPYKVQKYATGENIYVDGGKGENIAIGSHYDCVAGSPGANDNASAVAVALDVLARIKDEPLKNIGLTAFFFDEEENDLRGSQAYVLEHGVKNLIGIYNMELVGSGEIVALWPVKNTDSSLLITTLRIQADNSIVPTFCFEELVTNTADHASFRMAGMADTAAFTLTTISGQDILVGKAYREARKRNSSMATLAEIIGQAPVFSNYHKASDSSDKLNEKTLRMVSDLLVATIRKLDKL